MNNLVTFVGRVADGMLLVATMDPAFELNEYKQQAKNIIKSLTPTSPSKCTIESGPYFYHYIIEGGVCYLTLAEKSYPKRLAFQFLDDLQRAFSDAHGHEINRFSRPYAAISFDPKMGRIRKEYIDPRSPKNVQKLSSDLQEIHNIMVSSITEVLKRGEKLDKISDMSSALSSESKQFEKYSRYVNIQYMLRTLGPLVVIGLIVLFIIYYKFFS